MPDRRKHRGACEGDKALFNLEFLPKLREAVSHLSWLLSRGYADNSSLKLVGDRFQLLQRQRVAVGRCACSDSLREKRRQKSINEKEVGGQTLLIDGYNVLTTIEAALGGGILLAARDGCFRDMASMHGSYRKVEETLPALEKIGKTLSELRVGSCVWYLDSPVSNSGRLKKIIEDLAHSHGWKWEVFLVPNPDNVLSERQGIVATADSGILDRCDQWMNLVQVVIERWALGSNLVDLCV